MNESPQKTPQDEQKAPSPPPLQKEQLKRILLIITFAVLLYWAVNHLAVIGKLISFVFGLFEPFIAGLCIAFVMNVVLCPLEKLWCFLFRSAKGKLAQKLKRPVCLILSTVIVVGVVFAVLFMIIPEIKTSFEGFVANFSKNVGNLEGLWNRVRALLQPLNISLPELSATDWSAALNLALNFLKENSSTIINSTVSITAGIFSAVFNAVLAIAFSLYILAQKEKLGQQAKTVLRALLPQKIANPTLRLSSLTHQSFARFVTGQVTEAVIIGCLCFMGMLVFRFPYAAVISVLVGFTALIPIFGAFFGTAVGAFLILLTSPLKAFWFVIFIIVLQQLEGNLIYPKVVGKSIGLPGIWVLLAVTVGGNAYGLLGMLIAVPLSSVLYTLFRQFVRKRLRKKEAETEE